MNELAEGNNICVTVIEVASYGVTVECGDSRGIIQIPELSWDTFGLQNRISSICEVGDTLTVKILSLAEEKFYASLRGAHPELNPWTELNTPYVGQEVHGKVVLVADYGYMVKLPNYAVALLRFDAINRGLKMNQEVLVKIVSVDVEKKRISAGYLAPH